MVMVHQRGTVFLCGTRQKKWYGKFRVYVRDKTGKEIQKQRKVVLGSKSQMTKREAEQQLEGIIQKENQISQTMIHDDSATFGWFLEERYFPMKRGTWRAATKRSAEYEIRRHLLSRFKDAPIAEISHFDLQMVLNELAKRYAESTVKHIYAYSKGIMRMARKMKLIAENPADDLEIPETKAVERPIVSREQILALLRSISDQHDLCLMCVALFCGTRTGETLGLQWKSYMGNCFLPYGTAFEGKFYAHKMKTDLSRDAIPIPESIRPIIEAWHRVSPDTSSEALIFPTFGRGKRQGESVPRQGNNFLRYRIYPLADQLGIPRRLVTFQVMRRTLGTDLQRHGTMKDAQRILRHADITTTANIYMQEIPESVVEAINARTKAVLGAEGWQTSAALIERGTKFQKRAVRNSRAMVPSGTKTEGIEVIAAT